MNEVWVLFLEENQNATCFGFLTVIAIAVVYRKEYWVNIGKCEEGRCALVFGIAPRSLIVAIPAFTRRRRG